MSQRIIKYQFFVNRERIIAVYGVLLITNNSLLTEGHTYQFFVRATDRGTPSLHADVPVKVYIMDYADEPPVFQRTDQSFFLPEDTPIGSWFF